ncbi:Tenascin-R [Holothuria leucospilota]|uniref:Tenascin-R n=1 Tax=Holothuria leucospilota TaxID=206669 RepID=A0A9Q1BVI2_HOLLE|nr:Tenascin-R [Holothuria leucospilota]
MALSSLRYTFTFAGVCLIFLGTASLSTEGTNQFPSSTGIEGQGSSFFVYEKYQYPRDCKEFNDSCSSSASSGVHLIKPDSYNEPFEAYCDNENGAGGWTVILRRFDGSVDFKRNWLESKQGFGFLSTEFWLGNEKLAYLTNQASYELRIDITLENGTSCDVRYDEFRVSDEWSNYTIFTVGSYASDVVCRWRERNNPFECDTIDSSTNFTDCNDVYNSGHTQDGVYCVRPAGWNDLPFKVFCNMSIDGGSWIVFQRRVNGSTDFYRNWNEYKMGFGDIKHEFWLGNEKLHYLTRQATYEYRIDFVYGSLSYYNKYNRFRIDDETNKYTVTEVGSRSGTKGGSLDYTLNVGFSTYDQDNDGRISDCAALHKGAWWYGGDFYLVSAGLCDRWFDGTQYGLCSRANPNGDYNGGNDGTNIFRTHPYTCHITYTEIKIRRIS